jgi:hypothetical protein
VFLTPAVDILDENMPESVGEFLLQEKRTVEEHVQLFSSLPSEEEVLGGKVAERFKAMGIHNEARVQFGRTPAKEKLSLTKLWDQEDIASSREGSAGVLGLGNKVQTILSRMQGIEEETFDSSPYKESVSLSVTELAGLIQMQGDAIRGIESGTNQMTSRIEDGVVGLKANIGTRPANVEDLPGLQLWEIVSGLNRRLNDMSAELNNVELRLTQEQAKSVAAAISVTKLTQDVSKALADASFARGLATGHSAKVVDLELKIQSLEVRLVVAKSDLPDAKALSLLVQDEVFQSGQSVMEGVIDRVGVLERSRSGGVNFGAPLSTVTGGTDTSAKVTDLIERVVNLEDATTLIKSSLGGDSVMVGGEAHHTPEGLTGWVIKNVSSQNNCPTQMIIDIVSLLEQLQDINKSSDAKLSAKAQARKGGFISLSLARAITRAIQCSSPPPSRGERMTICSPRSNRTRNGPTRVSALLSRSRTRSPCGIKVTWLL